MKINQFELSQRFYFEAAHTLKRNSSTGETQSSKRIHGHTYEACITISGSRDKNGMVLDLGLLRAAIAKVREKLDHHFLDEIEDLGPATLENLCVYIAKNIGLDGISTVSVQRTSSGDSCVMRI